MIKQFESIYILLLLKKIWFKFAERAYHAESKAKLYRKKLNMTNTAKQTWKSQKNSANNILQIVKILYIFIIFNILFVIRYKWGEKRDKEREYLDKTIQIGIIEMLQTHQKIKIDGNW